MTDKPQNNDLDIVFVIDKSGSMYGSEEDTMGGFNSFIETQRKKEQNIKVTTVLFNDGYDMLYERKPINDVDNLTSREYRVDGSTALLDAIGKTVVSLDKVIDNKVLFVIMTDGLENSSIEYNKSNIKSMIKNHNWEFIFMGADIDSYGEASRIGIERSHVANYKKSEEGMKDAFYSMDAATDYLMKNEKLDEKAEWKESLAKYD